MHRGPSPRSNYVNVETPAAPAATPAPTPSVPATPTGLTSTSVTHDSVSLNWDDPEDSTITGYQVLRRSRDGAEHGDGEGASEFVAIVDDTGTAAATYTDHTVTARTRYVYRVKAINSTGAGPRSTYLNLETPAAPPVPAAPNGLAHSEVAHDSVTLTWDDPDDTSITGYRVSRRDVAHQAVDEFTTIVADTGSTTTSNTDATVDAETQYVYYVQAISPQGTSEPSNHVDVETTANPDAPDEPTGLTASSIWYNFVAITWDDPDDSSITHYQVLRRQGDTGVFTTLVENTDSTATEYTDYTVERSAGYEYRVVAVNDDGSSPQSESISVLTPDEEILTVVTVPEPEPTEEELQENLIALYSTHEERVEAFSATMTKGIVLVDGKTHTGYATGTPSSFGSMSSRAITHNSTVWFGCPDGTGTICDLPTIRIQGIYYVDNTADHADIHSELGRRNLFLRVERKVPDTFTLTIGDHEYSLADSSYILGGEASWYGLTPPSKSHVWRNVSSSGLAALQSQTTTTVTLDRPQYTRATPPPPPTDPDEDYLDEFWSATMTVGSEHQEQIAIGQTFDFAGYSRAPEYGGLNDDSFSYGGTEYEIGYLNYVQNTVTASSATTHSVGLFTEGAQLPDDASLYIGGTEYRISDAQWTPPATYGWILSEKPSWADRSSASVALEAPRHSSSGDPITGRVVPDSGWSTYHLVSTREGYQDWFVANLESGNRYAVQIRNSATAGIRGVYDPTGTIAHGATHPALKTLVVDLRARGTRHYPSGRLPNSGLGLPRPPRG